LEGADFSGVKAGQSGKQIFIAGAFAVAVAVAGAFAVAGAVAGAGAFAVAVAGAGAFAVAVSEFTKGNVAGGIGYSLAALFLLFLSYILLKQAIEDIRNLTGTSFNDTKLSKARFTGAILNNCDFTDANLYRVDWTHSHFMRCGFSDNLGIRKVREICISRIGTNEDFSCIDLSALHLVGVNLTGANLIGANLNGSDLSQTILENANLAKSKAIETDFGRADFTGACIEKWAITSETIFNDSICDFIFLDLDKKERKPASGKFEQGDFEKLVNQFTTTLDFLFRNGIDPQAFDFALNNLIEDYDKMGISLKGVEDIGDGDKLVRFNIVPDAPKQEMHAQYTEDYQAMHLQLEASRNKVWELQQKLDRIDLENKIERFEIEKQLAVAQAKLEERPTSQYLQNLVYHQANRLGQQKLLYAPNSNFSDIMTDKSIQSGGDVFFTGRDNLGVTGKDQQGVAGRDISGTVTNTIQQLRETNQPEAPQLADLLEELQKAVESSAELAEPDKEKALGYLNQIGEMSAKEPEQKKGMLPMLLDAFTGVISKAAPLIEPVKKIVEVILGLWKQN
jgi:uncharacterized protein YjbI with pentapeptide repeats